MSEDSNSRAASGGIGLCGALGIAFIVLKLCGIIDWSWWWVLAPIWIPAAVMVAVLLVGLIFLGAARRVRR